ncbi:MAG: hypothetical protein AAF959_24420 [Cyanobacteria bacterium P01_D01_bin.56]
MKYWRWAVFGLPVTLLCCWKTESQAADILIEFEAGATASTVSEIDRANPVEVSEPDPDAYLLNFALSQVAPAELVSQERYPRKAELLPVDPVSSDQALEDAPLPVPNVSIPTSRAITTEVPPPPLPAEISDLFAGGVDSLVARAVGTAEGTRTPDGQKTFAYYGHPDPGNQAWNQGTFSYQHAARSPEEADAKQLERLKRQTEELYRLASSQGLQLNMEEALNGIDLANQAPAAALDRGYIDWLAQAKIIGLSENEAILWARTRAFLDPDTGRWNAPGLGNSVQTITHDQARRQRAIAQALILKNASQKPIQENLPLIPKSLSSSIYDRRPDKIDPILLVDLFKY